MIAAISDRFEPFLFNKAFEQNTTSQPREDLEVITVVTELFKITESPSIGGLEKWDVMDTLRCSTIMDH